MRLNALIIIILALSGCLGGCRKIFIDPALPDQPPLVVEAVMTNFSPLAVTVSRMASFNQPDSTLPLLVPAMVTFSETGGSETLLSEIVPGRYQGEKTTTPGQVYSLTVKTDERTTHATAQAPSGPVLIDTITFERMNDTAVTLFCKMKLPPALPAYLRLRISVDGAQQEDIFIEKTIEQESFFQEDIQLFFTFPGSTAKVEAVTLSKLAYEFYRAAGLISLGNNLNPVNSKNPPTNFSPGATGFFNVALSDTTSLIIW